MLIAIILSKKLLVVIPSASETERVISISISSDNEIVGVPKMLLLSKYNPSWIWNGSVSTSTIVASLLIPNPGLIIVALKRIFIYTG